MKFTTQKRCGDCGSNLTARLISADAKERWPFIIAKSLPLMWCSTCDTGDRKTTQEILDGIRKATPPPD